MLWGIGDWGLGIGHRASGIEDRPLAKIIRTGSPAHELMKRIFARGLIVSFSSFFLLPSSFFLPSTSEQNIATICCA